MGLNDSYRQEGEIQMTKRTTITNELKEWIVNALNNGVKPEAIVDGMIKKGFDPRFSYTTLFRLIDNRPVQTAPAPEPYMYEAPPISSRGNLIKLEDREIKVTFKMDKPFIRHFDQLLTPEECDQLIDLAKDRLEACTVLDPKTGEERLSTGRTSKGMSFHFNENEFITAIEQRIAQLTGLPMENGESLQVLNYQVGEEYKLHYDYFPPNQVPAKKGGQRVATLLIYLNDVSKGGETVFPRAGISFVPKKGSAIYFHYANSKGQVDRLSVHTSIPVLEGEKWVATKWIRQERIYD